MNKIVFWVKVRFLRPFIDPEIKSCNIDNKFIIDFNSKKNIEYKN